MKLLILGTRGIPARHGGFETFAQQLAHHMVDRGHEVTVYCQSDTERAPKDTYWHGIHLVTLFGGPGPLGTIRFDLRSVLHALRQEGVVLTLGYNTAIFSLLYQVVGRASLMNMDGLEWMREKWSFPERMWLRLNEYLGARFSTHLIADHPEIGRHLESLVPAKKISVIAYGAETMPAADPALLTQFGCEAFGYALCIARPEPENSVYEIVCGFSRRRRDYKLIVLGRFAPSEVPYHRKVMDAASDQVLFPGAIYDQVIVQALRQFARYYLHGHRVGGTNPSLVEALAAGNAVVAHRNRFNQWIAGTDSEYFSTESDLDEVIQKLDEDPAKLESMRFASRNNHEAGYRTLPINEAYEALLQNFAYEGVAREQHRITT